VSLKEKLQAAAESYITQALSGLALLALAAAMFVADLVFPASLQQLLGTTSIAQIMLALILITVVMSFWIVYLKVKARKPKPTAEEQRTFIPEIGIWKDDTTNLHYCGKCKINPLRIVEVGWYCVTCHLTYKSPEFIAQQKERRRIEDERVKQHNSTGWMSR
jgi:hypothetical protein